jgi:hypothetical protein
MPNMKTKGQMNLKLLGGQEKTDGRTAGRTDSRTDKLIPVYPPYNFVVRGYKKDERERVMARNVNTVIASTITVMMYYDID